MKTSDWLILGGAAVVAYFLISSKPTTTGSTLQPVSNYATQQSIYPNVAPDVSRWLSGEPSHATTSWTVQPTNVIPNSLDPGYTLGLITDITGWTPQQIAQHTTVEDMGTYQNLYVSI